MCVLVMVMDFCVDLVFWVVVFVINVRFVMSVVVDFKIWIFIN